MVDAYLSAGDLSTFIIYALYVGANVGALAGVISNLIQARAAAHGLGRPPPPTAAPLPSRSLSMGATATTRRVVCC